jgi:hypothetical protein
MTTATTAAALPGLCPTMFPAAAGGARMREGEEAGEVTPAWPHEGRERVGPMFLIMEFHSLDSRQH